MKENKKQPALQLGLIYPNAAAMDVGSMEMFVAMPVKDGISEVKTYKAYTEDLEQLGKELTAAGVNRIAMEATGVYWMAVYEILEQRGINVTLVNAKHFKNTEAQKTDVKDCQWLQQLHAHGLLRASHVAEEKYRQLRTYIHERGILQDQKADSLNRIQKVLSQMNLKVQHLISDIEGVSGMKILRQIAAGIHEPEQILEMVDVHLLKAKRSELVKSLKGHYKPHYIQVLRHQMEMCDFVKQQMLVFETLIENVLKELLPKDEAGNAPIIGRKTMKARKNQYHFNLKDYLKHITQVDLTAIDGVEEITVLNALSVTGLDLSKWPTAEHFASWLNLAARPKKTGGKIVGYEKRFTQNPATQAFRMAAQSLWNSKTPLGYLYRRLALVKGSKKAIKAVARRLAVIFYHMLRRKVDYDPSVVVENIELQKVKRIARIIKEAAKYGYKLSPVPTS
jgi:transposase